MHGDACCNRFTATFQSMISNNSSSVIPWQSAVVIALEKENKSRTRGGAVSEVFAVEVVSICAARATWRNAESSNTYESTDIISRTLRFWGWFGRRHHRSYDEVSDKDNPGKKESHIELSSEMDG